VGLLGVRVKRDGRVIEAADVSLGGRLGPSAQLAREAAGSVPLDEIADVLAGLVGADVAQAPSPAETAVAIPVS